MDVQLARHNMIENQIRAWNVFDARVLALLAATPREKFIPEPFRALAFIDMPTPIGYDQVMLHPKEEGRVLQTLQLQPADTVLEIGTGSGYMTALLAQCVKHIDSVEIIPELSAHAKNILAQQKILNITLEVGDAARGWREHHQYDIIVITGSLPFLPDNFRHHLKPGGKIFAILGEAPAMQATLLTLNEHGQWRKNILFETVTPSLKNALIRDPFQF